EVDGIEAEALGGGTCELVHREGTGLDEHVLGRAAGGLALLDRAVDALLGDEAELDDDIGDEAGGAAAAAGRGDPGEGLARRDARLAQRGVVGVAIEGP